jgi:hypothetical protein
MKYITGTHQQEYHIDGVILPKMKYSSEEKERRGRSEVLGLTDEQWDKLKDNKVIKELISNGHILITDTAPVSAYQETASLRKALQDSEEERKRLESEAIETITALQEEIRILKGE